MAISQNIYDKSRLFRKILFQQVRPVGDYELNELQDILLEFNSDFMEFAGAFGFWGDGFQIDTTGNPNEFLVRSGVLLTGDHVIVVKEDILVTGLTTPGGARTDEVYVQVSFQTADSIDFPDIKNPLTNQELALRQQMVVEVKVAEGQVYPTIPAEDTIILFARLDRAPGSDTIIAGEIDDLRNQFSTTFVSSDATEFFRVTNTGGLNYSREGGDATVYGTTFSIASDTGVWADDSLNFLYVDDLGNVVQSTSRPTGAFLELYRVTTAGGVVTNTEDIRRFTPGGLTDDVPLEVIAARGSQPTLGDRLDVIMNPDGSLRDCVVPSASLEDFCPTPSDPAAMTVEVAAGRRNSEGGVINFAGGTSPTFTAPTTDPRIDLLYLNNAGSLAIEQGVEDPSPVNPSHEGKFAIAHVLLLPSTTSITDSNISDVRPLLRVSQEGGMGVSLAGSGLVEIHNTSPTPVLFRGGAVKFDSSANTVEILGLSGPGIAVLFMDPVSGALRENVIDTQTVASVSVGDILYIDLDLSVSPSPLTISKTSGSLVPAHDRVALAQRVNTDELRWFPTGENILDGVVNPLYVTPTSPVGLGGGATARDVYHALSDHGGVRTGVPDATNPYATLSDLTSGLAVAGSVLSADSGTTSPTFSYTIPAGTKHLIVGVASSTVGGSGPNFGLFVMIIGSGAIEGVRLRDTVAEFYSSNLSVDPNNFFPGVSSLNDGARLENYTAPTLTVDGSIEVANINSGTGGASVVTIWAFG